MKENKFSFTVGIANRISFLVIIISVKSALPILSDNFKFKDYHIAGLHPIIHKKNNYLDNNLNEYFLY